MGQLFKDSTSLGVIISRMQVPYLTASHQKVITTVQDRHNRVAILLGVNSRIEEKNPFPFDLRKQMLTPFLRTSDVILSLPDNADNPIWVNTVDIMIESLLNIGETATIYGGRDSFIPHYKKDRGKYECVELLPEDNDSGTELRKIGASKIPVYSVEVAEALLYYYNLLQNQQIYDRI